jgi:hypothetical protein
MTSHIRGGTLAGFVRTLEISGIADVVLPFLLIFTIIFAVLQRVRLFGEHEKKINVVVALIISLLTVIPHVTGSYSGNYDPVRIINNLIPAAGVIAVVIILILFLFGMFGKEFVGGGAPGWIAVTIFLILGYIFGATVGWWSSPGVTFGTWWGADLSTLIIIILVFGGIFAYIVSEPSKNKGEKTLERLGRFFFK